MADHFNIALTSGEHLSFSGRCHLAVQDGGYDKLKLHARDSRTDQTPRTEAAGYSYAIYETDESHWYFTVEQHYVNISANGSVEPLPSQGAHAQPFFDCDELAAVAVEHVDFDDANCPLAYALEQLGYGAVVTEARAWLA